MTAQQPEALRLRLAAEGHIALCKKFGPEGFHFDSDPQDVLAILARVQELEAKQERKPLTEAELDDLAAYHGLDEFVYVPFARAIERAHGIQDAQT